MTIGEAQRKFTAMVGKLIVWAYANGYELTFGDAFRSPEQAKANAAAGSGIINSLHCDRLAVDLNLFKDGIYHPETTAYQPLGEYFESLGGSWGGRFSKPDGNHFSFAWGGRR
jgi:hypothetical protein